MNLENAKIDIWQMGACDIAEAIRERKISCRKVIFDHLERIEAVNGSFNAITVTLNEQALVAADQIDSIIEKGDPVGPLAGVPVTKGFKSSVDPY